jgi:hypothetical protein
VILPMFYTDWDGFINIMCHAMALDGSFFNTRRMMQQYVVKAYFRYTQAFALYTWSPLQLGRYGTQKCRTM